MDEAVIVWRRLDLPGREAARLWSQSGRWRLAGAAVLAYEGRPVRLDYEVECDAEWRTLRARVAGWVGRRPVEVEVTAEGGGRWRLNGAEQPAVHGCEDVDLNFSPVTNTLPIRRLGLDVGGSAEVRAAWLRFPGFHLEPLEQEYTRLGEGAYRYESASGSFVRDLRVNAAGLVTLYPGLWEAEAEG